MILSLLKQSDLFKKIPAEELKPLIPLSYPKNFTTGSIIFSQNSKAEKVYLVGRGIGGPENHPDQRIGNHL